MCQHKVPVVCKDGRTIYVPCGKCEECLEHKQKEFMVRSYRAAVYYGSMHLITLSYDDACVPVSSSICTFDDNKVSSIGSPIYLEGDLRQLYLDNAPIGEYVDSRGRIRQYRKPWLCPVVKEFAEDVRLFMCLSFDKSHVQTMISVFRTTYKRKYGSLPEFKYVIVPEYGGRTGRPHFHLLVYGLSTGLCRMMCHYWKYGFTQVKQVSYINEDNSDGFSKCSAYVSKYVSKGSFEKDYVKDGRTFKPRITASRFLGLENQNEVRSIRSFCLGYDVFKDKYSVVSPFVAPRDYVDDSTGEYLRLDSYIVSKVQPTLEAISRRMYVNINDYKYPLPQSFKNVIYRVYDPIKKRYSASALSHAIMDYMEDVLISDVCREFEKIKVQFPAEMHAKTFVDLLNARKKGTGVTDCRAYNRLRRFYQKEKVD